LGNKPNTKGHHQTPGENKSIGRWAKMGQEYIFNHLAAPEKDPTWIGAVVCWANL
tara:strand:+ start:411 stop:575 length:165 start_codon:yes stop_codon:yes gene_type:complete